MQSRGLGDVYKRQHTHTHTHTETTLIFWLADFFVCFVLSNLLIHLQFLKELTELQVTDARFLFIEIDTLWLSCTVEQAHCCAARVGCVTS